MSVVGETKRLQPLMDKIYNPQCSVITSGYNDSLPHRKEAIEERSKHNGWDVHRCQNYSVYMIDGDHYCTIHAGKTALRKLMWEEARIERETVTV